MINALKKMIKQHEENKSVGQEGLLFYMEWSGKTCLIRYHLIQDPMEAGSESCGYVGYPAYAPEKEQPVQRAQSGSVLGRFCTLQVVCVIGAKRGGGERWWWAVHGGLVSPAWHL